MWNFNEVTVLEYRGGHVFFMAFDDGTAGEIDLSEYIGRGPVFEPLRDPAFFQKAQIGDGTISWPNGADIAPETLYDKLTALSSGAGSPRTMPESTAIQDGVPRPAIR